MHVSDFAETRENILRIVRGKPLFATTAGDTCNEVLSELRKMRELLEKSNKKSRSSFLDVRFQREHPNPRRKPSSNRRQIVNLFFPVH